MLTSKHRPARSRITETDDTARDDLESSRVRKCDDERFQLSAKVCRIH